jgi:hypothetical protein
MNPTIKACYKNTMVLPCKDSFGRLWMDHQSTMRKSTVIISIIKTSLTLRLFGILSKLDICFVHSQDF